MGSRHYWQGECRTTSYRERAGAVNGACAVSGAGDSNTPSKLGLFTGFFVAGITGFGGVLPVARRLIVEDRRWLSGAEFTELLALCQFVPGANVCNMSVALGFRFHGLLGALAAVTGLLAAPVPIALGLGGLYAEYRHIPIVQRGFIGLAAAAAGLILGTAFKIAWPLRGKWRSVLVVGIVIVVIDGLRLPLLPAMLVLAPFSVLLHR